jgi:oligosaccharyltransferase complex subunit delta (ribophorin II)
MVTGRGLFFSFFLFSLFLYSYAQNPLKLSLVQGSLSAGKDLKVRITDSHGNFATKCRVYLIKAYPSSEPNNVIIADKELHPASTDDKEDTYSFNFLLLKPDPGFYTLHFSATPLDKKSNFAGLEDAQLTVKVLASVALSDFEFTVLEADDLTTRKSILQFGQTLPDSVSVESTQKLRITFKLRNQVQGKAQLRIQQAFIKFTHLASHHEVILVASPSTKQYALEFTVEDKAQLFKYASGDYEAELIVGDSFVQNPFRWNFGRLRINFPASEHRSQDQSPYKKLSEITHQFRAPEKRPPESISLGFTGLSLSPILLLLLGLLRVGANLKRFPSGINGLFAMGFEGGIIAILLLFVLYWLQLNMFTTLGLLSLLAIPTIFFGQKTLSALALSSAPKSKLE